MGQFSPITVSDGENNVTFNPDNIDSNRVASWNSVAPSILESSVLSTSNRRTAARRKTTTKLTVPSVATCDTDCGQAVKVNYVNRVEISTDFDLKASTSEREAVIMTAINALQDALIMNTIINNESIY